MQFIKTTVDSLQEELKYIMEYSFPTDIECSLFKMDCYLGWLQGIIKDNVGQSVAVEGENG